MFVYHPEFVSVAFKTEGFSGNFGGVGPATPGSVLAFCAAATHERFFTLFLYDEAGVVTTRAYPFDSLDITDGGPDRVEEIHITGNPVVVLHDGIVKVFYAQYRNGQTPYLMRFNTGYRLE